MKAAADASGRKVCFMGTSLHSYLEAAMPETAVRQEFTQLCRRMAGVKAAADASGRKICFMGTSLHSYLEAAERVGRAPIDPRNVITPAQAGEMDNNEVLIITTGSQVRRLTAGKAAWCSHIPKLDRAPIYPRNVITPAQAVETDNNEELVSTTGSQVRGQEWQSQSSKDCLLRHVWARSVIMPARAGEMDKKKRCS